jgi:large conductance mechanosensitive channel
MLQEFKEFAIKGNFVDLAVAVVLGGASGKVVTALVEKVIMPPIGILLGKVNFADLKVVLQSAGKTADGVEIKEVAIGYGAAIQATLDFLLVAFVVFLIVRAMNRFKKATPPPEPPAQEKLLVEIRDLLAAGGAKRK